MDVCRLLFLRNHTGLVDFSEYDNSDPKVVSQGTYEAELGKGPVLIVGDSLRSGDGQVITIEVDLEVITTSVHVEQCLDLLGAVLNYLRDSVVIAKSYSS